MSKPTKTRTLRLVNGSSNASRGPSANERMRTETGPWNGLGDTDVGTAMPLRGNCSMRLSANVPISSDGYSGANRRRGEMAGKDEDIRFELLVVYAVLALNAAFWCAIGIAIGRWFWG